jgi:hypothetical protein
VLHDEDLAQAILDRVLERGRLIRLDGPSVRTLRVDLDDAMKDESDQPTDLIRISGNSGSEFPEPTPMCEQHEAEGIRGHDEVAAEPCVTHWHFDCNHFVCHHRLKRHDAPRFPSSEHGRSYRSDGRTV